MCAQVTDGVLQIDLALGDLLADSLLDGQGDVRRGYGAKQPIGIGRSRLEICLLYTSRCV